MKFYKKVNEATKQKLHSFTIQKKEETGPDLNMMKRHSKFITKILGKIKKHKKVDKC